jgi:ABC-type multidrug transport system fused ATPase/permease subunit
MERSLLSFIWRHARRDHMVLIVVTLALFPLLYLTMELPKRIINDAIGAKTGLVTVAGVQVDQTVFLVLLCCAFLLAVIAHGLLKMRVNTMKGVLAERLLRRFRFALIGRIVRFPRRYQQQTSEGELVAALTAEAEPLGGVMGDAIANPLLQTGQMLTILLFLFLQNVWFGLAAIAMIPVQAWIIPYLQKRINLLNRSRVRQVRSLAAEIGEISSGAATLRQHGAWPARLAAVSAQLGLLFTTRFDIYRKKFFMKFVNNLLTQITPFFFFLVGGILVINDALTLGALVASLSAFKDLSAPWKELLSYYTTVQEVSQRYQMIVERFDPPGLLGDFLGDKIGPRLPVQGASFRMRGVSLADDTGRRILNGADLDVAAGEWLCLIAPDEDERTALTDLALRDAEPDTGTIEIDGTDLRHVAQHRLAGRVGHARAHPFVFRGTIGENVMLPLQPGGDPDPSPAPRDDAHRSKQENLDPDDVEQALGNWLRLIRETRLEKDLLGRALDRRLTLDDPPSLALHLAALRTPAIAALSELDQDANINSFSADIYFDDLTLPENLLVALKDKDDWIGPATTARLRVLLIKLGLLDRVLDQSRRLARTLIEAFDQDTASSPLFRRLGVPGDMLPQLQRMLERDAADGRAPLRTADEALLLALQFNVPARAFDRAFSAPLKQAIVNARAQAADLADETLLRRYLPLNIAVWHPRLSVLENIIFGVTDPTRQRDVTRIRNVVIDLALRMLDTRTLVSLIEKLPVDRGGANLSAAIAEHISLAQVIVKRPALVILDRALASFPQDRRQKAFALVRALLPDATILQLEAEPPQTGQFDRLLEVQMGQILPPDQQHDVRDDTSEASDIAQKLAALRKAPLFRELTRAQLRLLAFSARWLDLPAGSTVFRKNDAPDGAYLIFSGTVELYDQDAEGRTSFSLKPPPGTLVGELGLIRNDPRRLGMRTLTDVTLLRIDAADFLSILETDAATAFKLIQHLIGYLDAAN